MDHEVLVYKVDNPVQSSLLSFLVFTLILSKLKVVDFNYFHFLFISIFFSIYFFILFLELGLGLE